MTDQNNNNTDGGKKPSHYAYHVRESSDGKGFWNRIGAAWSIKDGGFTIQLDTIPLDGRIVCTLPKESTRS